METGRQLYQQGLTVGTDGNLSCRVTEDTLWTTATGARKGFLTDEWLVKTDLAGNILEGTRKPSSELKMHLCLYQANPRARLRPTPPPVRRRLLRAFCPTAGTTTRCYWPTTGR